MKKEFIFTLLLFVFSLNVFGQSPNWQWAKSVGGGDDDGGRGIASDDSGNVYVTGWFRGPTITFGAITLTNVYDYDIFIVKYDASGNALWAKSAGGTGWDRGYSIVVDDSGNVYVTGQFNSSTLIFGTDTLTHVGSIFSNDIFIVKYDALGNVLWAKSAGGTSGDEAFSIAADGWGNIYVTGRFSSPILTFGTDTLTNTGTENVFVVKYTASGNILWAKSASGRYGEIGISIVTDATGNAYVTGGSSSDTLIFGTDTLYIGGTSNPHFFIVKYDTSGNVLWAKSGGGGDSGGGGIVTDISGNAYMTGNFHGLISFGTILLTNPGGGLSDIFIAKYDSYGNVLWARSAGGTSDDFGVGISTDTSGNVSVIGQFYSSTLIFGTDTLTNAGSNDIFIAECDTSGNVLWAKSAGGVSWDYGYGIVADTAGDVYITGYFNSPTVPLGINTLTNAGNFDIFIAKLASCYAYYTLYPDTVPHNWFALNQASGIAPLSYLWTWGDGDSSTGAFPSHTYATAGYYNICLTITDALGCSSTYCDSSTYLFRRHSGSTMVTINVVAQLPTDIPEQIAVPYEVKIYPNPATNQLLVISYPLLGKSVIEIYNLLGETLSEKTFEDKSKEENIDVSNLIPGMYFVKVSGKDFSATAKFIKQ